jgi:small subunit ribosomal protein S1
MDEANDIAGTESPNESAPNEVGEVLAPVEAPSVQVAAPEAVLADPVVPEVASSHVDAPADAVMAAAPAVEAETIAAPVDVTPVDAAPVDAAPVDVTPVDAAPVDAAPVAPVIDPATFTYQPGDIVPGTIVIVGPNGIEVDLGEGEGAVIPRAELVDGTDPVAGEHVEGTVIRHQAGTGRYVISPKRAARTRAWTKITAAFESGEPIKGTVKDIVKGGIIVDVGMRAFLPESLIDVRKPSNLKSMIGKEVTVKVVECERLSGEQAAAERRSEKVVVNRRAVIEVERREQREKLMNSVKVGDKLTGKISALTDFGAFVDLGEGEGLIHVSELAHRQVAKPSDVVKVGQKVDVVVIDIKADKGKISLSRKAALPNPWTQFAAVHKPGDLVFGNVTGLAAFGAFVMIEGDGFEAIEGLIHISELSRFRVETPSEVVNVGEGVWTQVLAIEPDKKRVSLSLRRALES